MNALIVIYAVIGLVMGAIVFSRRGRTGVPSAILVVLLWPLIGPVIFAADAREARAETTRSRIEDDLKEGVAAAEGTPLATMLSSAHATRILSEVARVERRRADLETLLVRSEFDLDRAHARVRELERSPTPRVHALATARLHLDNVLRLHALREADERALDDLGALVSALRTQLVLARFSGASAEGVGGLVQEVWARVEGLSEAMEDVSAVIDEDRPVGGRVAEA